MIRTFTLLFIFSLSTGMVFSQAIIRIVSVDVGSDDIIIQNLGDSTEDISNYQLCLGPGQYNVLSDYTETVGDLMLSEDQGIIIDLKSGSQGVTALPDTGGLGLFVDGTDFNSTSPDQYLDYVQWRAGDQPRVDQAVTAGRWDNAGAFVGGASPYLYFGEPDEAGANGWLDDTAIRFKSITPEADTLVIQNFDSISRDLSNYWLCTLAGIYPQLGNGAEVEVLSGDLDLAPGDSVSIRVLTQGGIVDGEGSVFLFSSSLLGFNNDNGVVTRDFAQWGAGNGFRVENAVAAGRWDEAASFIPGSSPFLYLGDADDIGAEFWQSTPTSVRRVLRPDIRMFPNPTLGPVRITNPGNDIEWIRVINISGQVVLGYSNIIGSPVDIDLKALPEGIYSIEVLNQDQQLLQIGRVVKR